MITLTQIQAKLADALKNCGMTQTALAQILGIRQQTISHYIKGDIFPALDTLANLCAVLDLDANEILCLNERDSLGSSGAKYNIHTLNNHGKIDMK